MQVHVVIDNRFLLYEGELYDTYTQPYSFWTDYLEAFDEVVIVGRACSANELPSGAKKATGPKVSIETVPYWEGPRQFMQNLPRLHRRLTQLADRPGGWIVRVPGPLGNLAAWVLKVKGRAYATEVVGEATDAFGDGPVGRAADFVYDRSLRWVCANASAASYVTESALQMRYPADNAGTTSFYSSIRLSSEMLRPQPKTWESPPDPIRIVHIGSMLQDRKGQDVLVRAAKECVDQGLALRVDFAGDGPFRESFEDLANSLDVAAYCTFHGTVPRKKLLFGLLDEADLLVLPTRNEGLPRTIIESMARGTPVLATPTCGVPEVLPPSALVEREPGRIADRILEVADSPSWLSAQSGANLERAHDFTDEILRARRRGFYTGYRGQLEAEH